MVGFNVVGFDVVGWLVNTDVVILAGRTLTNRCSSAWVENNGDGCDCVAVFNKVKENDSCFDDCFDDMSVPV